MNVSGVATRIAAVLILVVSAQIISLQRKREARNSEDLSARQNHYRLYAVWAAILPLMLLCIAEAQGVRPGREVAAQPNSGACVPLVIQGRIAAVEGAIISVKTPEDYPGTKGIHSQIVVAGITYKADVSKARVLLPDGRRTDTRPLAVGENVVLALRGNGTAGLATPTLPASPPQTYSAIIVERLATGNKFIGH